MANESAIENEVRSYVLATAQNEILTRENGYKPVPIGTDFVFPAVYLKYILTAMESFNKLQELTEEQKEIIHWKIVVTEMGSQVIVRFSANLFPSEIRDGEPEGVAMTAIGPIVRFVIDKESNEIKERVFEKN